MRRRRGRATFARDVDVAESKSAWIMATASDSAISDRVTSGLPETPTPGELVGRAAIPTFPGVVRSAWGAGGPRPCLMVVAGSYLPPASSQTAAVDAEQVSTYSYD